LISVGSVVQVHPDPPQDQHLRNPDFQKERTGPVGAIAQLGERLLCKQEVTGSIPVGSTSFWGFIRNLPPSGIFQFHFAVRFIRLLFNNSEEVKRTRFSQTGFVWV
jgi:hypothetical protein